MKKEYDFKGAQRGRFFRKGAKVRMPTPRVVEVRFKTTKQVHAALMALRDTGFFGDGCDSAAVAEELVRYALLDPEVWSFTTLQLVGVLRRLIEDNHLREHHGEDTAGVLMKCGAFHEATAAQPEFVTALAKMIDGRPTRRKKP